MKRSAPSQVIAALAFLVFASATHCLAAEAGTTAAVQPAKLPYGVQDVLKLTQAKVAEETIVSFVENSGTVYNLAADDIVYLRNEGVSDRVVNAMLDQKKKFIEQPAAPSTTQTASTPAAPPPPAPTAEPPATSQPAPVYVQPPTQPPPSTVYVVPYPAVSSAYYGYYRPYPYYYGGYYGGYWGPSISLGFRFGGGHYWGGHGGHWGGRHH